MLFQMRLLRIGENLIKSGLILRAQWQFSGYQTCHVTLMIICSKTSYETMDTLTLLEFKVLFSFPSMNLMTFWETPYSSQFCNFAAIHRPTSNSSFKPAFRSRSLPSSLFKFESLSNENTVSLKSLWGPLSGWPICSLIV